MSKAQSSTKLGSISVNTRLAFSPEDASAARPKPAEWELEQFNITPLSVGEMLQTIRERAVQVLAERADIDAVQILADVSFGEGDEVVWVKADHTRKRA